MNQIFRLHAIVVAILASLAWGTNLYGELITVEFSGTVTSVSVGTSLSAFDFPDVGDSFTGFYKFDSTAPDVQPLSDEGIFVTMLSETAIDASIGSFQFEGMDSYIYQFQDVYHVGGNIELTSNPALAQIVANSEKTFSLTVRQDNLLSSDPNILLSSPPSLDGATERDLAISVYEIPGPPSPRSFTIFASLDSLTVVPEPSGIFLVGLATLTFRCRHTNGCGGSGSDEIESGTEL